MILKCKGDILKERRCRGELLSIDERRSAVGDILGDFAKGDVSLFMGDFNFRLSSFSSLLLFLSFILSCSFFKFSNVSDSSFVSFFRLFLLFSNLRILSRSVLCNSNRAISTRESFKLFTGLSREIIYKCSITF